MLTATNPYNGEKIDNFPSLDKNELYARIGDASAAFADWSDRSFAERGEVLRAIARQLRAEKHDLAQLMALEMGKPIKEGVPEVEKAAFCAEYYADNGEQFLTRDTIESDASLSYVCYQPLGTLLGILPWNAPLWLAFRYLAPALMAGNTCVMKHDPHVPQCAQRLPMLLSKPALLTTLWSICRWKHRKSSWPFGTRVSPPCRLPAQEGQVVKSPK